MRRSLLLLTALLVACTDDAKEDTATTDSEPTGDTGTPGTDDTDDVTDTSDTAPDTGGDTERPPATTFEVTPDDPALRYVGRWSVADPAAPNAGWQGSSVGVRFDGTDLSVTLDAGSRTEHLRIIVDGDHVGSVRVEAPGGEATYALAEGLAPGEHTVELVKETYAGSNLAIKGFSMTGWSLLVDPAPARHIEFYGDSNLAGSSLMSEKNEGGWSLVGSHFSYAGITARAFGADYHNLSTSGETLSGATSRYDRQDRGDSGSVWDFAAYTPDVVVMNLGANDIYGASEETIRGRYVAMLDLLRAAHPAAHIVVYNGWGWDFDETADYTAEVVADYGDPNVSVAIFPWVFEQWHGCETDHAGMAMVLIDHLASVMGWEAGEQDVMSGYGAGGELANGGFEQVAPFGGFGWRYYTDGGVERLSDGTAHEGAYFLRLPSGAEVHQPNPARGGQEVEVTLWLRGASEGEQAEVTVDFRDQEMYTAPIQSETTSIELTADWARYTVSATAPEGGPRPVFHTRLTLASAGGTLDVDGLEMTTE